MNPRNDNFLIRQFRSLLPDLTFFAGIYCINFFSKALGYSIGQWTGLLLMPAATLLSWLLGGYVARLQREYKAYDRPDLPKYYAIPRTVFTAFLVFYSLLYIGQGFFLYPILQPLIPAVWPELAGKIIRVLCFVIPAGSALLGYLKTAARQNLATQPSDSADKLESTPEKPRPVSLRDDLYAVLISLLLYIWLEYLLRAFVPAIMRSEMLFSLPLMMFALLVYGPFPLRLAITLRPPFHLLQSLLGTAVLVWLAVSIHGNIQLSYQSWLNEDSPLDFSSGRLLQTPYSDQFDSWNPAAWHFYSRSSDEYSQPPEAYLGNSQFIFRGDATYTVHSSWFPVADSNIIRSERRIKFEKGSGSYKSSLQVRLAASERRNPMLEEQSTTIFVLEYDDPGIKIMDLNPGILLYGHAPGQETSLLSSTIAADTWLTEKIELNLASGSVKVSVGGQSYNYSIKPQNGRVWAVLFTVTGEYRQRLLIDSFSAN